MARPAAQQGGEEREGGFHTSANPDTFPCAAFRRGLRVVGIGFQLDDLHDLLDGQIGLRVARADTGDGQITHGAVEVGREDLGPFCRVFGLAALELTGIRFFKELLPVRRSWRD